MFLPFDFPDGVNYTILQPTSTLNTQALHQIFNAVSYLFVIAISGNKRLVIWGL